MVFVPTDEMVEANKQEFINILKKALSNRKGANVDGLINKLLSSDFFVAPASTKYHGAYRGGLVDHCLNVYHNAMSLARNKHLINEELENVVIPEGEPNIQAPINSDSIAIVTLLHDMSKMNYYKINYFNKKVYCESGSKHDENGKFDWVSVPGYQTIPQEDRFLYGSHEETSEFMLRQFVPLTYEESTAILHHHFALSFDSIKDVGVVGNIYNRYPLAVLLHVADTISAYIDEAY